MPPSAPCAQLSRDPQGVLSSSPCPLVKLAIYNCPVPMCPHSLHAHPAGLGPPAVPEQVLQPTGLQGLWGLHWGGCAGAVLRLVKGVAPVLGERCIGVALGLHRVCMGGLQQGWDEGLN